MIDGSVLQSAQRCFEKKSRVVVKMVVTLQMNMAIDHFHISHNTPWLPPKILHKYCFKFLLRRQYVPREIENNAYAKCWGANKVYYGRCESGECTC